MNRNSFAARDFAFSQRDAVAIATPRDFVPAQRDAHGFAPASHRLFVGPTPALPAGKSLVIAESDDGGLSLISDVEGGVVTATQNSDGSVTIVETLSDGSQGDVITIPAPASAEESVEDSAEESAAEDEPEDAA